MKRAKNKTGVSIIACIGKNRELGKNNGLIWKIPEDLKYFKKTTLGHSVIMGERTYHSIGKLLSKRTNIVLSKNKDLRIPRAIVAHSITEAVKAARRTGDEEVFFIGGGKVYEQAIKLADKLYLTIVDDIKPADAFFPDYSEFRRREEIGRGVFRGIKYEFLILRR